VRSAARDADGRRGAAALGAVAMLHVQRAVSKNLGGAGEGRPPHHRKRRGRSRKRIARPCAYTGSSRRYVHEEIGYERAARRAAGPPCLRGEGSATSTRGTTRGAATPPPYDAAFCARTALGLLRPPAPVAAPALARLPTSYVIPRRGGAPRRALRATLAAAGIGTVSPTTPSGLHEQPQLRRISEHDPLPGTEIALRARWVALPNTNPRAQRRPSAIASSLAVSVAALARDQHAEAAGAPVRGGPSGGVDPSRGCRSTCVYRRSGTRSPRRIARRRVCDEAAPPVEVDRSVRERCAAAPGSSTKERIQASR
jgi:hypothetical protein